MIYVVLNAVPILAATIAGLAVSALHAALTRRRVVSMADIAVAALAEFWLAAILAGALILAPPRGDLWTMALGSAFVIWIGFVVPVIVISYRFRDLPSGTAAVDCLHWLAVMLLQATVLRLIGLVPPPI